MIRQATVRWRRCYNRMGACDGIGLLGVLAAARERFSDVARLLAAADAGRHPLRRWSVRHEKALTEGGGYLTTGSIAAALPLGVTGSGG